MSFTLQKQKNTVSLKKENWKANVNGGLKDSFPVS